MHHVHQRQSQTLVTDRWILMRDCGDCDCGQLVLIRLIDGRRADSHVHGYDISSTQEYRGRVEYRRMVSCEEKGRAPVVRNTVQGDRESVGDEFGRSRRRVRYRHVVGGLLARLDCVIERLGLGQSNFDETGENVDVAYRVSTSVILVIALVRVGPSDVHATAEVVGESGWLAEVRRGW